MDNFSILDIKNRLKAVIGYFDYDKSMSHIIDNCVNSVSDAEEIIAELVKIDSQGGLPFDMQKYFGTIFEDLKLLAKKDKEIYECLNKISILNDELTAEFDKRNLEYNTTFSINWDYLNMSYKEKKDYLYYCNKEINNLSDKLSAIALVKNLGEIFEVSGNDVIIAFTDECFSVHLVSEEKKLWNRELLC